MKVAFLYQAYESLGLEYLSAVLKQHGHETRLFFEPALFDDFFFNVKGAKKVYGLKQKLLSDLIDYQPDVVCFSVVTNCFQWSLDMSRAIKENLNVPIVFGGTHPTAVPEVVMENDCVDFAVVGDGEYALLEIVEGLMNKTDLTRIRNVWARRNGQVLSNPIRPLFENFDNLPWADKDIYFEATPIVKVGYKIVVGRGCLNRCSYCFTAH